MVSLRWNCEPNMSALLSIERMDSVQRLWPDSRSPHLFFVFLWLFVRAPASDMMKKFGDFFLCFCVVFLTVMVVELRCRSM